MKIVLADEDAVDRKRLRAKLAAVDPSFNIVEAPSADVASSLVRADPPLLLLLDVRLANDAADRSGLELLRALRDTGARCPVVVVTDAADFSTVRAAFMFGAQAYLLKREVFASEGLPAPIVDCLERARVQSAQADVRGSIRLGAATLLGTSGAMDRVRGWVRAVADADAAILLRGETGTGKDLVARAIHDESRRRSEPFVAVNCAAIPSLLLESVLFGHERGAFTGADRRNTGVLEKVAGGTLFLDEIGEMPLDLQPKLLRVLEERRFAPIGAGDELPLRARVVAATNAPLEQRIVEGRFRADLFHRLDVLGLELPALAARTEDIPELVAAFASRHGKELRLTAEAMERLRAHPFSGNVRELRNVVDRLSVFASGTVGIAELAAALPPRDERAATGDEITRLARAVLDAGTCEPRLVAVERALLKEALRACDGNKSAAARLVGLDRKAFHRRLARRDGREA